MTKPAQRCARSWTACHGQMAPDGPADRAKRYRSSRRSHACDETIGRSAPSLSVKLTRVSYAQSRQRGEQSRRSLITPCS
jgi:hypothetical protein